MMRMGKVYKLVVCLGLTLFAAGIVAAANQQPLVGFQQKPGELRVSIGGQQVATYVWHDEEIHRPYFAHVRAPGGIQVTRNHPPVKGKDPTDHATYHPGLWMAFGDIGGADNWRGKASVISTVSKGPVAGLGEGSFTVRNIYLRYIAKEDDKTLVCVEECKYTFLARPAGYVLISDSTFDAKHGEFYFGDQEEMGLGVRVATAITEKEGGLIRNANGLKTAKKTWGEAADWCDYSGTIDGKHVGVTLMCDPANFRPSWFHARNYGLLLANPFGRKAFDKGDASKVVVKQGETFRLRYGVLLHASSSKTGPDLKAAYNDFLEIIKNR